MIYRKGVKRPDYVYPADPWRLVEKRFYPRLLAQTETFFATANGYLGMRGSFEEGRPTFDGGTFVTAPSLAHRRTGRRRHPVRHPGRSLSTAWIGR